MASLVLHTLLLYALPLLKEAQRRLPAKMTARLAAPKPPEPEPQKTEAPAPRSARQLPATRSPSAMRVVPQPVAAAPLPSVVPANQQPEPVLVAAAASPAPAPQAEPPAALARTEPQAAALAAGGIDPGTLAQFRLELMDHARRFKRYPRVAQDNLWEGRVELRIAVGEDGAISSLAVKKGSGRAVLDDEAQAMIRSAKSKATIPAALRGKAFTLEIPVDFLLQSEEK